MKGQTSCFKTLALIQYVRARRPENLHLLWEPLKGRIADDEDPEAFLSDPKNRVSIELCRDIMEQAKKATSDDMAVYKAARSRAGKGKAVAPAKDGPGAFLAARGMPFGKLKK